VPAASVRPEGAQPIAPRAILSRPCAVLATLCVLGETKMEYRTLGGSLKIPALMLGTATFGGGSEFLRKWGATDVKEATGLIDIALSRRWFGIGVA
jgi:hypothetical protein